MANGACSGKRVCQHQQTVFRPVDSAGSGSGKSLLQDVWGGSILTHMQILKRFKNTPACTAIATMLATPLNVLAQSAAPQPQVPSSAPAWQGYAILFGLIAVVIFISLMPSKRSHLD